MATRVAVGKTVQMVLGRLLSLAGIGISILAPDVVSATDEQSLGGIGAGHGVVEMDATVTRIDPRAGRPEFTSDLLGMFGATPYVTPDTWIVSEGKPAPFTSLHAGSQVRVALLRAFGPQDGEVDQRPSSEQSRSRAPRRDGRAAVREKDQEP